MKEGIDFQVFVGRLSDVKDMFDRTLIIATSTILCSQGVSENNMPDPDLSTLTKRLEEMIEREDMSLNALASELAKISAPEENQAERITQLESLLQKMLSRNSASCKALVNGLGKVKIYFLTFNNKCKHIPSIV